MAGKRKFDDKATWRTGDTVGIDTTQPARAERALDPNDTITDDPTPGGIGGGTFMSKTPVQATGVMYTGLNDDPTQMVNQGYRIGDTLVGNVAATLTTALTGTNNDLVFTAKARGTGGNAVSVTYTDPGGATATLSVSVTGSDITVNLGRAASAINTTATALAAAVTGDANASALVTVQNAGSDNGSGLVTAMTKTNLSGGSDAHYV